MKRAFWTVREVETLVAMRGKATHKQIAEVLGRSVQSVYLKAQHMGIARKYAEYGPEFDAFLKEKNAEGYSDSDVAEMWGGERHTVAIRRKALGLPNNMRGERWRQKIVASTKRQLAAESLSSLAELQQITRRLKAFHRGWPPECTPLMCDILDFADAHEFITRREFCAATGRRYHRCKSAQTTGGKSAFQALINMGLLERHGRRQFAPGKGRTEYVYSLAGGVKRRKKNPGLNQIAKEAA